MMTEVDLTRLLSGLSKTADTLNEETKQINTLIARVEQTIRGMQLGVEAWGGDPVRSEPRTFEEMAASTDPTRRHFDIRKVPGSFDVLVGFAKGEKEWELRVRYQERRQRGENEPADIRIVKEMRLLDAPRTDRIAAFKAFPGLIELMQHQAEEKIREIQAAKKLIK